MVLTAGTNDSELAMMADADGDGATDWQEWQAGTNPCNPSNRFEMFNPMIVHGELILRWQAVGSATYEVVCSPTIVGLATQTWHVGFVTATGGVAPWFETSTALADVLPKGNMFYQVNLVSPQRFEQSTLDMATFE